MVQYRTKMLLKGLISPKKGGQTPRFAGTSPRTPSAPPQVIDGDP